MGLLAKCRDLERRCRPVDPRFAAALRRRWSELPDSVKTPGQLLGRHAIGCEGTHGVFPRCNLACTPCYHSRDANRVRVDGEHTRTQVEAQMRLLHEQRGPVAHAQLIGGEVTLLDPEDHAATLEIMRRYGREPMSMSHGDFDYDYLERLVLGDDGRPRLRRLSFAGHFDMQMFGRRGLPRPPDERSLNPSREAFTAMFRRLRKEHGVRSFLAHTMTVTPTNLDQVATVVRDTRSMGFGMFSFQPAAFLGDERRWHENYRAATPDAVWAEVERGVGRRLDFHVFENGDVRCNRVAHGFYVADTWHPVLDGDDPADLAVREAFFRFFGEVNFSAESIPVIAARVLRVLLRHPVVIVVAAGWLRRAARRVGGLRRLARARPTSFVMHTFMDADQVVPAWELMQAGVPSDEPEITATQERLRACHYTMAHPENGTLVPACVQHAVLDPGENAALRTLLPLVERRPPPAPSRS
jgi:hypothetical protein